MIEDLHEESANCNLRKRSNNQKRFYFENGLWFPKNSNEKDMRKASIRYGHFEEVLQQVNPFGTYQIFVCICIVFAQVEWGGLFIACICQEK